jgi:hypothetical protein
VPFAFASAIDASHHEKGAMQSKNRVPRTALHFVGITPGLGV